MKQKKLYKVLGINTQNPFNPLLIFAESNHTNTNHIKQNQKRNQGGKIRPGSTIAVSIDARQSSGRSAASGEIRPGDRRRWSASMRVRASGIDRRSASGIVAAWRQSSGQRTDDRPSIATRAARFVRDRRSRSASMRGKVGKRRDLGGIVARPGKRRDGRHRCASGQAASAIVAAWRDSPWRWSASTVGNRPGGRLNLLQTIANLRRDIRQALSIIRYLISIDR